ncbi:rhomboid family intramembrane serine protease [Brevundimonas basaltis]|uniref:rhomboid family intramembrane serine protease n=1 Tax=Brevundimonas basaltis TaxID=472166 RepID=UPI0031B601C6
MLLAASLPVLFWLQTNLPDGGLSLAFQPAVLMQGEAWSTLFTSMFMHHGWTHVLMNAVAAFAFGPPVARLMRGPEGAASFLGFYIVTGLVGAVGYALVHPDSFDAVGGASAAVFGLMGAAFRLLGRRDGTLRPLTDRRFLLMAAVIMAVNIGVGLIGLVPGAAGARVAWEAHAFGFVAGALLIGPWLRLLGPRRRPFDSPPNLGDPPA